LFIIVREIGLDGDVFAEFGFGAVVVLFLHVGESETKVDVGQVGICRGGNFQLGDGFVQFFAIEIGLAKNQMELGSLASDFDEVAEGLFVKVVLIGVVGGDVQDVEVCEIVEHLGPEGFQDGDGFGVVFGEDVAETKQVRGLRRVGLIADDRGERGHSSGVVAASVFYEADVKANARHFGLELLGFLKKSEGVVPLFAAHSDDAEVGVSRAGLRIDGEHAAKSGFGSG